MSHFCCVRLLAYASYALRLSPKDDASEYAEASTSITAGGTGAKLTRVASADMSCTTGSCCEILTDLVSFLPIDSFCASLRPICMKPAASHACTVSYAALKTLHLACPFMQMGHQYSYLTISILRYIERSCCTAGVVRCCLQQMKETDKV